jgi:hypothetical protein
LKAIHLPSPTVETHRKHTLPHRCIIPLSKPQPERNPVTLKKERPPKQSQSEKRIEFLLKKHFDDDPDFRPLILELAELDPTTKKKYLAWLVKHWLGDWKATKEDKHRVAAHLATHHQGAKYFSPLTWTGLRLEDAGYHADIFKYTPETIESVSGKIAEIIRTDEEDKQIRKGNPVAMAGADLIHRDEEFTIIRIRTGEALKRFGQNTSWCVRHGDPLEYRFPFDFILDHEGNRYLANRHDVRDRWNDPAPFRVTNFVNHHRRQAQDPHDTRVAKEKERYDQFVAAIKDAIHEKKQLTRAEKNQVLLDPDLAIYYAEEGIRKRWIRFEQQLRVADLTATQAVRYAVRVREKRWRRFENKIKRSVRALAEYRAAFPGSIPKTDEEIFKEQLKAWRSEMPLAHHRPLRLCAQGRAECLQRDFRYEASLSARRYSMDRYCRFLASLATSSMAERYRLKVDSYFVVMVGEAGEKVNRPIARELCRRFERRMECLEKHIAKDAVCSMNYAMAIGERFVEGEAVILADPKLARKYRRRFLR